MSLDLQLFQLINNLAGRNDILDGLARLLVNEYFLTTTMALILVTFWFEGKDQDRRDRNQRAILRATIALFIALSTVTKSICSSINLGIHPFPATPPPLVFP